jgi:hypothetical protein
MDTSPKASLTPAALSRGAYYFKSGGLFTCRDSQTGKSLCGSANIHAGWDG